MTRVRGTRAEIVIWVIRVNDGDHGYQVPQEDQGDPADQSNQVNQDDQV